MTKLSIKRRVLIVALFLFGLLSHSGFAQDDPCELDGKVTDAPATLVATTSALEVGLSGSFGSGITDIGFGSLGGEDRIMVLDPLEFGIWSIFEPDLQTKEDPLFQGLQEFVMAFAPIPDGHEHAGSFYVVDAGLGPLVSAPQIGVMAEDGVMDVPFTPITSDGELDDNLLVVGIDVSPDGSEIVIVGSNRFNTRDDVEIYFLDLDFKVTRGPFRLLGRPVMNLRTGVCYNSCGTVLALSALKNNFELDAALEYDAQSGEFTGRGISLVDLTLGTTKPVAIGLDTGEFEGRDVLYTYGAHDDAVYALELEYSTFPGLVSNFDCAFRADSTLPTDLSWTPNLIANFDSIAILQDGVLIDSLAPNATSLTLPPFKSFGHSEFAIELRLGDVPSEVRSYCKDISSGIPQYAGGFTGVQLVVEPRQDPFNPNLENDLYLPEVQPAILGIDTPALIQGLENFRLFYLDTFEASQIQAFDSELEDLPPIVIADGDVNRFTGLALIEEGETPQFALLGRNDQGDFSAAIIDDQGQRVQEINPIDLSGVLSPDDADSFLNDWDRDEKGNFVAVDYQNARLYYIEYDSEQGTMVATDQAPIPVCALGACEDQLPLIGGVTVLPSGQYLVASGGAFDLTINRAFLTTPFSSNSDDSVKFTGFTLGLWDYSDFQAPKFVGRGIGPNISFGLTATQLEYENPDTMETITEDILFFSLPHLPTSLRPPGTPPLPTIDPDSPFRTYVVNIMEEMVDPNYQAEQLVDMRFNDDGATANLEPSFNSQSTERDFLYNIVNRGDSAVSFNVIIHLNDQVDSEFSEKLEVPPGRFVNRALLGRSETSIKVELKNIDSESPDIQVLVGSRAIAEGPPPVVFLRGDVDGNGSIEISDPINNLVYQFLGQGEGGFSPVCLDAHDFNDDGLANISDPIANLSFQFLGTTPPAAPGGEACGVDPTDDSPEVDGELGCEAYPADLCP